MKLDIHDALPLELQRIAELTQRTNKCTNGKRYTLVQLKTMITSTYYKLYTMCLSDKFSNLGIAGAVGMTKEKVDLFSLSCRALGRQIENRIIEFICGLGINQISFHCTMKNSAFRDLLETSGFICIRIKP